MLNVRWVEMGEGSELLLYLKTRHPLKRSSRVGATPKLNEANNVYFAANRKSLNAFVCLRMRTKEATDIILGWIRSRENILFDELKTRSVTKCLIPCMVYVCYRQ